MSSKMSFADLVHKVLHESGFWSKLKSDPEGALKECGYHPTPAQVKALKSIDYNSIRNVAQSFQSPGESTFC
jgi:hypothetical protein